MRNRLVRFAMAALVVLTLTVPQVIAQGGTPMPQQGGGRRVLETTIRQS